MKMFIVVDPYMTEDSIATIYQDRGGYRLHRLRDEKFKGDAHQIAHWCASLKARYPEADLKIEDNGIGMAVVIAMEEIFPRDR